MATSKLIMRVRDSKQKPTSITLLFRYESTNIKYSTGIKISPNHWNKEKELIKSVSTIRDRDHLNRTLMNFKLKSLEIYNHLIATDTAITNEKLLDEFNKEFRKSSNNVDTQNAPSPFLTTFLDIFVINAATKKVIRSNSSEPLKESTIKNYKHTLKKLKEFNTHSNANYKFSDLSLAFHNRFIHFLSVTKGYANGTVATRIKDLKSIAKHAKRDGVEVNEDVFTPEFFKPVNTPVDYEDVYLNEEEIKAIMDCEFQLDTTLDIARDWLIIGLWTGQRISDFLSFTKSNFNGKFIKVRQMKTGTEVLIPKHIDIKTVLAKREGELPRKLSHQKFNKYIKDVCEEAEIKRPTKGYKVTDKRKTEGIYPKFELITSHTCRRSFATNHYGKVSNYMIMGITGHKTEITFLKYLKKTNEEQAEALLNLWNTKA